VIDKRNNCYAHALVPYMQVGEAALRGFVEFSRVSGQPCPGYALTSGLVVGAPHQLCKSTHKASDNRKG
jgi:hypothetical protein